MAPSNTTRPRTGSLSLRHNSTLRNFYANSITNNNGVGRMNNNGGLKSSNWGVGQFQKMAHTLLFPNYTCDDDIQPL